MPSKVTSLKVATPPDAVTDRQLVPPPTQPSAPPEAETVTTADESPERTLAAVCTSITGWVGSTASEAPATGAEDTASLVGPAARMKVTV